MGVDQHGVPALLRLDEAARALGMSRRTLERRIAAGEVRVFRDGRIVGVPAAEVARYVAAHTVRAVRKGVRTRPRTSPATGGRLWD